MNIETIARENTEMTLNSYLYRIARYYMYVYDEYHKTGSRDSAFLKDLVDSLIGIEALLEVYVEKGELNPDYAIEKLEFSKSFITSALNYYEHKKEEMKNETTVEEETVEETVEETEEVESEVNESSDN